MKLVGFNLVQSEDKSYRLSEDEVSLISFSLGMLTRYSGVL